MSYFYQERDLNPKTLKITLPDSGEILFYQKTAIKSETLQINLSYSEKIFIDAGLLKETLFTLVFGPRTPLHILPALLSSDLIESQKEKDFSFS